MPLRGRSASAERRDYLGRRGCLALKILPVARPEVFVGIALLGKQGGCLSRSRGPRGSVVFDALRASLLATSQEPLPNWHLLFLISVALAGLVRYHFSQPKVLKGLAVMKLFVESFEPVLYHRNGEESHGEIGIANRRGEPYSKNPPLYIHHLDIDPILKADLQPFTNPRTGGIDKNRFSLPNGQWFLCEKAPKAFILVNGVKCQAKITQLDSQQAPNEIHSGPALRPEEAAVAESREDPFVPVDGDWRKIALRLIKERRGQQAFRDALRERYGDICLFTGCDLLDVLEAAHIKPFRGEQDNNPQNGLLLRSDVHTLFDLDLIGIEPKTLQIHVHMKVKQSEYRQFDGTILKCSDARPSDDALQLRWKAFRSMQ